MARSLEAKKEPNLCLIQFVTRHPSNRIARWFHINDVVYTYHHFIVVLTVSLYLSYFVPTTSALNDRFYCCLTLVQPHCSRTPRASRRSPAWRARCSTARRRPG